MSKTIDGLSDGFGEGSLTPEASLVYKNIYIPSLAQDIILFGKEHGEEIVHRYGLDASDLALIMEMPVFKAEVRNLRALMDSGIMVTTQMRAASALSGSVDVLANILLRDDIKPTDAVAVTKALKEIATMTHTSVLKGGRAKGDEVTSSAGMVVNFSFGGDNGLPPLHDVTPSKKPCEAVGYKSDATITNAMFSEVNSESV